MNDEFDDTRIEVGMSETVMYSRTFTAVELSELTGVTVADLISGAFGYCSIHGIVPIGDEDECDNHKTGLLDELDNDATRNGNGGDREWTI